MSNENEFLLPPKNEDKINKKSLVLDLDETLLHSQIQKPSSESDYKLKLNKESGEIYINFRPGVKDFIRKMNKFYELIIFTASKPEYANPIINLIDERKLCSHKLFRDHCSLFNKQLIKDLTKLGRDLKDIIIVDNTPSVFSLNKENGIPIPSWFEDKRDRELYNLMPILEFLSVVPDVREFIPKFVINNEVSYLASLDIMRKYKNDTKLMKSKTTTITEVKSIENSSKETADNKNLYENKNTHNSEKKINDNNEKEDKPNEINKDSEEKNEKKEDNIDENNVDLLNLLGINKENNNDNNNDNNNEETKDIKDEIILNNYNELNNEENKIDINKEIHKNNIDNKAEDDNKDEDNKKMENNNKTEDNKIEDDNKLEDNNKIQDNKIENDNKIEDDNKTEDNKMENDNKTEANNNLDNYKDNIKESNDDNLKEDSKINDKILEDKNLNESNINNIDHNINNNMNIISEINDFKNNNDNNIEETNDNIKNVINQNPNNNNDIKENINDDLDNKLNIKENENISIIQNNDESKNIENIKDFNCKSKTNIKNNKIDTNKDSIKKDINIIKKDSGEINLKDQKKMIESTLLKKEKIRNYSTSNSKLSKKRNNSKSSNISLVNKNKFSTLKTIDTNRIPLQNNKIQSEKKSKEYKSNDKIKNSKEKISSYKYKDSNEIKPFNEMKTIYSSKSFKTINQINERQIKSKSPKKLKYHENNKSVTSFFNLIKSKSKKEISIENIKTEFSSSNSKFRTCRCVSKQETFLLKKNKDKKLKENNNKDKIEEPKIINLKNINNNNNKNTLSIDKKRSRPMSSHLANTINIDSPSSKNKFLFNRKKNISSDLRISSPKKERNIKNNLFVGPKTPKQKVNLEYNNLINRKKIEDNRYNFINKIINSPSKEKSDKKLKFSSNKSIDKGKNNNGNINTSPRKNISSRKNCFVNKSKEKNSIENRLPWGWGAGYYKKNSDSIKKIKYNLEELETKSIKFNAFKNSNLISLCKSPKKVKNNFYINNLNENINTEENSLRKKRGLSSYATFNTSHKIKEEQKNKIENN